MYFVYVLLCERNGKKSLYMGYTHYLNKRMQQHFTGNGGRYTRAHPPISLEYIEQFKTRKQALQRELKIKKMSKKQKLQLIYKF